MKKLLIIVPLALLCAAPAFASDWELFGSYWDTSDADNSFGGGLGANFNFGDSPVGLELRGTYFRELSNGAVGNLFDPNEGFFKKKSLRAIPVDAGLRFNFATDSAVQPWIDGGASYIFLDLSNAPGAEVDDETGWYAGGGLRFGGNRDNKSGFFVQGLYRDTTATVKRSRTNVNLRDRVNIDLSGVNVNAGFAWAF
jgi:Outer membrane protein beta-barrel domain